MVWPKIGEMLRAIIIRQIPAGDQSFDPQFHHAFKACARGARLAWSLFLHGQENSMTFLRNPLFWDKKIRIAVLTIATFMALC